MADWAQSTNQLTNPFVWLVDCIAHSLCPPRVLQRTVCSEMAQELRFAVRCIGSSKKPRFKRHCSKCKKGTDCDDGAHVCEVALTDSANGVIQLREVRRSPGTSTSRRFETEFTKPKDFTGEYLHVDYSDGEA